MKNSREDELFEARIEDYLSAAERGRLTVTRFLTPKERKIAEQLMKEKGAARQARFWGGYPGAERTCLFVIPEFYADCPDWMPEEGTDPALAFEDEDPDGVASVRVCGSGFRKLTHRDYLGSLLGLGLERDALGDIALQSDSEAVIFCKRQMTRFLTESLEKVASDTVRCKRWTLDESFTDGRKYRPISDTVASARLDCVVAALTNLSRETAQNAVRSGLVDVEFETVEQTDFVLEPPVTLSVRGYGKYILRSFDGETRKGRMRLRADQLI